MHECHMVVRISSVDDGVYYAIGRVEHFFMTYNVCVMHRPVATCRYEMLYRYVVIFFSSSDISRHHKICITSYVLTD